MWVAFWKTTLLVRNIWSGETWVVFVLYMMFLPVLQGVWVVELFLRGAWSEGWVEFALCMMFLPVVLGAWYVVFLLALVLTLLESMGFRA